MTDDIESTDSNAALVPAQTGEQELKALGEIARNLVEPFADSQKVSEIEATKRHAQSVAANFKVMVGLFILAALVLGLAYVALAKDNPVLAEKVIFAVVGFLGGLGVSKFIGQGG